MGREKREDQIQSRLIELLKKKTAGEVNAVSLVKAMLKAALGGEVSMMKYITDRVDGKPKEEIKFDIFDSIPSVESKVDPEKYLLNHKVEDSEDCFSSTTENSDIKTTIPN